MESNLAQKKVELATLKRKFLSPSAPEILEVQALVDEIENLIEVERQLLVSQTGKNLNKGNSFSDWIYKSAKKRRKIALFNDMYTSTIDAKTCSNLIVSLSTINSSGIYNLGSKNALSKKDFELLFVKKLKKKLYYYEKSCDVLKVKRVKNLSLNVTKVEKKIGLKMP